MDERVSGGLAAEKDSTFLRGEFMQLRDNVALWPPWRKSPSGSYRESDELSMSSENLPEAAILHEVKDHPLSPPSTGAQRLILITDQGSGNIFISSDAFRLQLSKKLQDYAGRTLREIGDLEIDAIEQI
jgi:hypothetical protein